MIFINSPRQFADESVSAIINGQTLVLAVGVVRDVFIHSKAAINGQTDILAVGSARDIIIHRKATIAGQTNIAAFGVSYNHGALIVTGETKIQANGFINLSLSDPDPILNEISATAFQHQKLTAKLFVNNVEVKIKSFDYSKPKGSIGSSVSIVLAKADLSQLPSNAVYKFQIGKYYAGAWHYTTILDNAILDSRNYALAFLTDTLSFSTIQPLADKLDLCPRRNIICYSSSKISVSLDEIEPLYDVYGHKILTVLRSFTLLSLYQVLNIAFVEGCGFASVHTNLPNFEISRCDFSITNSYLEAVSGIIGVFEPLIFAVGNVLWILDKTQAIPDDFTPNPLTASRMTSYSSSKSSSPIIDGYLLQFTDSNTAGNYYTDELKTFTQETGDFGDDNYTSTEIVQTFRHWKNTGNPDVILKTDLIRQVEATYAPVDLVGRTIEDHTFDGQGKRIESRKTIESLVPSLPSGTPSLQTVREEIQQFFYTNDRQNPRRFVQDKSILRISGMYSIDSENQYLGEDFKQDFLEAHKAGNLTESMTTGFGSLKTITENLEVLGNGQIQVKTTTVDHLRNSVTNSFSDVRNGDTSINSISKVRKLIVWRDGVDLSAAKGARIVPFSVGELPFVFALPLAQRRIARQLNKPESASIEVAGFDESLDIGVYFAVSGREDINLGKFLTLGFSVSGSIESFITRIEAEEI